MTTQEILQGVHDWTNGKIVYDISVAHPDGQGNPTKYADLTAALGTGGANIPEPLRKGGMSVKFIQGTVQSSDNKYVQFRFMLSTFTAAQFANATNWQGVDDDPTAGSKNLVESCGVLSEIQSKEIDVIGVVPIDWFVTSGIPYYSSDGIEQTNANRKRTNYIKVNEGDAFAYTMNNTNNVLIIAVFNNGVLDLTHSVAGAGEPASGTYTVPVGITHIQFCNNNSHTPVIIKTNPTHLDDEPISGSDNLVKSGGVYKELYGQESVNLDGSLSNGFYQSDLSVNTNALFQKGIFDVALADRVTINASVRGYAYISIVDNELNILWQSNSLPDNTVTIDFAVLSGIPKYVYFCNETSVVNNPSIILIQKDSIINTIEELKSGEEELKSGKLVDITPSLSNGYYKRDLTSDSDNRFKKAKIDISAYKDCIIQVNAALRNPLAISLTNEYNEILYQTQWIYEKSTVLNLKDFISPKYLYFCNETSVLATPSVKVMSDVSLDSLNNEDMSIRASNRWIHISFDDVSNSLADLTTNAATYKTIFASTFFSALKQLHDKYDARFSLFCFNETEADNTFVGFNMDNVTDVFADDFVANSDWLKFSLHSESYNDDFSTLTTAESIAAWNRFITNLKHMCGGSLANLDLCPRFQSFLGTEANILALRDCNPGIIGLLTADDTRNSYYLNSVDSEWAKKHGKFVDINNRLIFYHSHVRLESADINYFDSLLTDNSLYNSSFDLEFYTHESTIMGKTGTISQTGLMSKVGDACKYAKENNIPFTYPMYEITR